nr:hypothetical protein [Tanacetum cinerariifolium]
RPGRDPDAQGSAVRHGIRLRHLLAGASRACGRAGGEQAAEPA